jgi:hypothetical protein
MKRARLPASDFKALSQLNWRIPSIFVADANVGEFVTRIRYSVSVISARADRPMLA